MGSHRDMPLHAGVLLVAEAFMPRWAKKGYLGALQASQAPCASLLACSLSSELLSDPKMSLPRYTLQVNSVPSLRNFLLSPGFSTVNHASQRLSLDSCVWWAKTCPCTGWRKNQKLGLLKITGKGVGASETKRWQKWKKKMVLGSLMRSDFCI